MLQHRSTGCEIIFEKRFPHILHKVCLLLFRLSFSNFAFSICTNISTFKKNFRYTELFKLQVHENVKNNGVLPLVHIILGHYRDIFCSSIATYSLVMIQIRFICVLTCFIVEMCLKLLVGSILPKKNNFNGRLCEN